MLFFIISLILYFFEGGEVGCILYKCQKYSKSAEQTRQVECFPNSLWIYVMRPSGKWPVEMVGKNTKTRDYKVTGGSLDQSYLFLQPVERVVLV